MKPLSRRAVLQGAGVLLALPWLERIAPVRAAGASPRRLVVWHVPNGMVPASWTPGGDGLGWTASPALAPLEPWRSRLTIPLGVANTPMPPMENHHARALGLLSGRAVTPWASADPAGWTTMDQVAADALRGPAPLRSLELGSEAATPCSEAVTGQVPSCAGYQTISWREATPLAREVSPRRVFERLFGAGAVGEDPAARAARIGRESRLIDKIREDHRRLSAKLGAEDRARLDGFVEGVDELERALNQLPPDPSDPCAQRAAALAAEVDLDAPMDLDAHVDVMRRLLVLALQCDQTRVVSYMLGNERSNRPFPQLGVTGSHHAISHHASLPDRLADLERIAVWEVEQLAALLSALDAVVEPEGTLLDTSAVLFCASMSDPNLHDRLDLPLVLAGGACGGHTPAGVVRYPSGTPVSRLHLTLLRRLGVDVGRFGDDGDAELAGW